MAGVTVVMSSDDAALFRSYQKMIDQANKLAGANKNTGKESAEAARKAKEAAQAQAKAEREHLKTMERGKAMVESLRTPQEIYNAKLREAVEMKREGAISVETLQRRYRQLKTELNMAKVAQERQTKSTQDGNAAMGQFGKTVSTSLNNVTALAASYFGVQQAVILVTGSIQEQIELQREQLEITQEVAKAQQDAIKNFTGLTPEEKRAALIQAADIQRETGFTDRGQLVEALGAGFSASGDIQATVDAVEAAAQLSRLTPDQVAGISSGALDIGRGSGVTDAESNLGFLLQAGSFARIEDPTLLAKNLAPAVASASGVFPGDKEQVAKESAALFAAFSRAATDKTGESTSTATITFNQKLAEFFAGLTPERRAELGVDRMPTTPLEAARVLQQNETLRTEFTDQDFGEARFKDAFKAVFDPNSAVSQEATATAQQLQFGREKFDETVAQLAGLTPELVIATAKAKSEALSEYASLIDPDRELIGAINEIRAKAVREANQGGVSGVYSSIIGQAQGLNAQMPWYQTPEGAAANATRAIDRVITDVGAFGTTEKEQQVIDGLIEQKNVINQLVQEVRSASEAMKESAKAQRDAGQKQQKPATDAARLQAGLAAQGGL